MMKRTSFLTRRDVLIGLLLCAPIPPARAFDGEQFDAKTFAAYQDAGKPILIEAHAGWCPVCWKQGPIVTELLKQADLAGFVRITVEYDMEKDILKRFNITKQSTFVVFKGKTETGRSIGDTNKSSIEKLLRSAL
jgi:thiol-disulfide isomerase/thioredoxin